MAVRPLSELVESAREMVAEESVHWVHANPGARLLIDIRERHEWDEGHVDGAHHISRGLLETHIAEVAPDPTAPVALICAVGVRSLLAATTLLEMGYSDVASVAGGFSEWKREGLPFEVPAMLTSSQLQRYSRHLRIPEIGPAGQLTLLNSKVLVLGAGGLGSPACLYLAAAGVGTLGLIDPDVVEASNLQRQVLHTSDRIGTHKTESGRRAIHALNAEVRVVEYPEALTAANAQAIFSDYDVILNGCDNFPTRYLANDVAIFCRKPLVDGSAMRFEGQVTTVLPFVSACFRCRYPNSPPPGEVLSCDEAGVLGVVPGIIGSLQAAEVLKIILGIGDPLAGRLLHFDALRMEFREFLVDRDPACPACGDSPTIATPRTV